VGGNRGTATGCHGSRTQGPFNWPSAPPEQIAAEGALLRAGYGRDDLAPEMAREASRGAALAGGGGLPLSVSLGATGGSGLVTHTVSGAAAVDQTLHIDISLEAGLIAALETLKTFDFSVPLNGSASTGTQDTDASPQRSGYQ